MNVLRRAAVAGAILLLGVAPAGAAAQQTRLRGSVEAEARGFASGPAQQGQTRHDGSFAFRSELSHSWGRGDHLLTFEPFLRWDAVDGGRTHADIRVLSYERAWRDFELRVGVRRVFWGVTESRHLVDIINQTDRVENPDGEDKLGQPMVNVAWLGDLGTVDLYLLVGFRQPTFAGGSGRLRPALVVDPDLAVFSDDGLKRHLGWAARWSRSLGLWDVGVAHFEALAREPRLEPGQREDGTPVLIPHYDRIEQTSIDAQWTTGGWLWKLEGMTRSGQPGGRAWAMVSGFEYTLYQVLGGAADLGLLGEVLLDTRDTEPFQDDLFLGARLVLNDVRATELLAGAIVDRSTGATLFSLEAGRRLNEAWTAGLEVRAFAGASQGDPLYGLRRDDYASFKITRWF